MSFDLSLVYCKSQLWTYHKLGNKLMQHYIFLVVTSLVCCTFMLETVIYMLSFGKVARHSWTKDICHKKTYSSATDVLIHVI